MLNERVRVGFISNQWLNREEGVRARGYRPVLVEISSRRPSDVSSLLYKASLKVTASKANGEYQTLYLSETEAEATAAAVIESLPEKIRERLLLRLLRDLPDARLLRTLALDLSTRVRLSRRR